MKYSLFLFLLSICLLSPYAYAQVSVEQARQAQELIGLEFDEEELKLLQNDLRQHLQSFEAIRKENLDNGLRPALVFNPIPYGASFEKEQQPISWSLPPTEIPANKEDMAFYSIGQLAYLLKNKKITSLELTRLYLERLKRFGDTLQCLITLTEDLALEQAARADREIEAGNWRGPLHGIPYGIKDLLALPGYKTTWGASTYRDQERPEKATVVAKLEEAGAVLVAKLTLGALAWGDVWYGGQTKNPWNLKQGASGSSAGSASATVAGLVGFSIGTETLGSIVSPSTRCGASGLRPTFGRVSKYGAMALSWTMDKIGPICRHAEDCAMVFDVIMGKDDKDPSTLDFAFNYDPQKDIRELKIGYATNLFEQDYFNYKRDSAVLKVFADMGVELIPLEWKTSVPVGAIRFILEAEAAAAFDELTRSNQDSLLVRQIANAWPNVFRAARFIPAVEYIQANRLRYQLIQEVHTLMQEVDVLIVPSFAGNQLTATNLTGQPVVVVPNGFDENGSPTSICFLGNLFGEAEILRAAKAYQEASEYEDLHPKAFLEK